MRHYSENRQRKQIIGGWHYRVSCQIIILLVDIISISIQANANASMTIADNDTYFPCSTTFEKARHTALCLFFVHSSISARCPNIDHKKRASTRVVHVKVHGVAYHEFTLIIYRIIFMLELID